MSHVTFLRTAMSLGFLPCCLLATLSHETPVTAKGDSPGSRSSRQQRFQGENTVFALSFKKKQPLDMSEEPVTALELSGWLLPGPPSLTPQAPVLPSPQTGLGGERRVTTTPAVLRHRAPTKGIVTAPMSQSWHSGLGDRCPHTDLGWAQG